jgi:hypothetical protein
MPEDSSRPNTQSGDVVMLAEQLDVISDVISVPHPVSKADATAATTAGRHPDFTPDSRAGPSSSRSHSIRRERTQRHLRAFAGHPARRLTGS